MRLVVAGLGVQGRKRIPFVENDVVAMVDPVAEGATFRRIEDVPLDSFDAALVCTPDREKVSLLRYLLGNGKHVLVEKPLTANDPRQLEELGALATKKRLACYTAYNHRFETAIVRLKEILDARALGRLYMVRMFYGNGTAQNIRASPWRDADLGVLSDLGSHLLDLGLFLFGEESGPFSCLAAHRFETRAFDHAVLGSAREPAIELEMSYVSWKNTFAIDVIGDSGSAHIEGLSKWGPTTLRVRKRVFPSGVPEETVERFEGGDRSWGIEYEHFLQLCERGATTIQKDLWILRTLQEVAKQAEARSA